jgi:hypothetical protein
MGHFKGFFEGALNPKEKSLIMRFAPDKKNNNLLHFQHQSYIGIFMSRREREREREEREREKKREKASERVRARARLRLRARVRKQKGKGKGKR